MKTIKASELVAKIQQLIAMNGDCIIGIRDHAEGNDCPAEDVELQLGKSYGWDPVIGEEYVYDSFVIK